MTDRTKNNPDQKPKLSRREVLVGSAATAFMAKSAWDAAVAHDDDGDGDADDRHGGHGRGAGYVYVGSAYFSDASKNGISTYTQNPETGALSLVTFTPNPNNPSFFALNRSKKVLYASNEVSPGTITAYTTNADGSLTLINVVPSSNGSSPFGTGGPAYIAIDPSGKYLMTASWGGAYISAIKINSDGSLGALTDTVLHSGNLGPNQTQPHPHMILADPTGKYILVQDLGQDRTYIYTLDSTTGKFSPGPTPFVAAQPGAGPRHFAFHPDGHHMYSINEVGSTINVYYWSASNGSLTLLNSLSTLPKGYVKAKGINTCAEIVVSSDGNYVYGSNRTFDSIVTFSIRKHGLALQGAEPKWTWVRGETPRNFALSPDGRHLYAAGQNSSTIAVFEVDQDDGDLKITDEYVGVTSPTIVFFT